MIQGISGFAFGIILLGVLPHFLDYTQSIGLNSLLGLILGLIFVLTYRKYILWRAVPLIAFCYILGDYIGIQILSNATDMNLWRKALGIFLIIISIFMCCFQDKMSIKSTRFNSIIFGLLGGIIVGLFGVAPIIVLYFVTVTQDKNYYMGTMQTFFFICNWFDVLFRSRSSMITGQVLEMAVLVVPFLFLGFILGRKILRYIPAYQFKLIVYGIIFINGLLLVVG